MKRDQLKEYFRRCYSGNLLVEQEEDDLFGNEGGEEEDAGATGDEGGEESGGEEATADDEAVDDAGDTETEAENDEVEIEPEDEVRLGKQLDHAIDGILTDFETDALKSAAIEVDQSLELENQVEWWNKPISSILFEQEDGESIGITEADLDIDKFAGDVAHLIKNYDVMLDMEDIIFKKAFAFLIEKYDETIAKAFEEALMQTHDLDFSSQSVEMEDSIEVPLAVGASGGDGGGGAV